MFCPMQPVVVDIRHAASRGEYLRNRGDIELTGNGEAEFFLVECESPLEPSIENVISECIVLKMEVTETMEVFFNFRYADYLAAY